MMTAEEMAALHARAFAGQGRAWSAQEFADLLENAHVFSVGGTRSFAVGRVVADEAELLTIATDPQMQGQGLGRACLLRYESLAVAKGATSFFLEVADDNAPALALYRRAGYQEAARRRGYYHVPDGRRLDALILRKTLP